MRTGTIYALCDPDTGLPKYVGKTVQTLGERRGEHIREATTRGRDSAVHRWTRSLLSQGFQPVIKALETEVPVQVLNGAEKRWIAGFRNLGFEMLNYTGGGNGALVMSEPRKRYQGRQAERQGRDSRGQFLQIGEP